MGRINYFFYFALSFVASFLLTPLAIKIATRLDIVDFPGKTTHTIHQRTVPRAGGLAIFFSLVILVSLLYQNLNMDILITLSAAVIIFMFGLWDDRFGMTAPLKLLGQSIAITILILNGIRVQFFENPEFFITLPNNLELYLDIAVTYFWLIFLTNAFNLIDSMDGLALGVVQIINGFFLLSFFISNQLGLALLSIVFLGINFGLLFYNKLPAKTFLGDSGAQMLGFIMGVLAILYHPVGANQSSTWFVPILVFGVPIFDTTLVTFSRLLRKIPFYKASLDHTYHRMVQLGLSAHNSILLLHLISIFFAALACLCIRLPPLYANIIFGMWLIIFFTALFFLEIQFQKNLKLT